MSGSAAKSLSTQPVSLLRRSSPGSQYVMPSLVVVSRALFLIFPCNHIINKKQKSFSDEVEDSEIPPPFFYFISFINLSTFHPSLSSTLPSIHPSTEVRVSWSRNQVLPEKSSSEKRKKNQRGTSCRFERLSRMHESAAHVTRCPRSCSVVSAGDLSGP